ncbi:lantibiotic dehydratase [Nannocystaceae bacterium ST9]
MSRESSPWVAGARFVLRVPMLAFDELLALNETPEPAAIRERVRACVARPEVLEALYLASPSLVASLPHWQREPESPAGQASERVLLRYLARMATRATPFGFFSAVAIGTTGGPTRLGLGERADLRRHTQLDNAYLSALLAELARDPEVRERLRVHPNSSVYRQGDRLRYVETRIEAGSRRYELASVTCSEAILATLERSREGVRPATLAEALVADDPELALADALAFVEQLVDIDLLVGELELPVTGDEPLAAILARLAALGPWREAGLAARVEAELRSVERALTTIDARGLGQAIEHYRDIEAGLAALPVATRPEPSRTFQAQLFATTRSPGLAPDLLDELARASELVARLTRAPSERDPLRAFAKAFRERYDEREVPLLEALDDDAGIGFERGTDVPPLLEGVRFDRRVREPEHVHGRPEQLLLHRLGRALAAGSHELVVSEPELAAMAPSAASRLPDAWMVLARLAASSTEALARGEVEVMLAASGGPSGARMLGRHCHGSPELRALVEEHVAAEAALWPDAILAEVVHLDEGRVGNITCRPVLRDYEIPFLGGSGAPSDRRIGVDDLWVSVRGEQVVLRSRRLGKRVVPRMTNAHNHRIARLAVYRFLCKLQDQDGAIGLAFDWPVVAHELPFLPRLRVGRVILARARWRIRGAELEPLRASVGEAKRARTPEAIERGRAGVLAAMLALRAEHGLPDRAVVAEYDNELLLDFANPLLVESVAWHIAAREQVVLHELWPAPEHAIVEGAKGRHLHELIVTFTRREPTRASEPPPRAPPSRAIRRSFGPGSEWLYAKLYTGSGLIEPVLREVVAPLREQALRSGAIDRWFFVRYDDPDHHLRVRFHGPPERLLGELLPALDRALEPWLSEGRVHRLVLDTYTRELERYGASGIVALEALFHADSEAALAFVEQVDPEDRHLAALRGIDSLWASLGLDAAARSDLALRSRDALRHEFAAEGELFTSIGARFRRERARLVALLDGDERGELGPVQAIVERRARAIAGLVGELEPTRELIWSVGHMHANRVLTSQPRAQELILYDLLHRFHVQRRARA